MLQPYHKILAERRDQQQRSETDIQYSSWYTSGMHPNPRFYKYYWWVFSKYSSDEGDAFFANPKNRLSGHQSKLLIEKLTAEKEVHFIYNQKVKRSDRNNPWDLSLKGEWAPAYENDTDPTYSEDHK